jgi:predicted Zn-dependent peptidase
MSVQFRSATLPNGLKIIAECNQDAHTSAVGFFVKTGARDEPRELMGVSHYLEHMMFKGSPTRSAEDVNRHFDRIGASHNAFTTSELTAFHAHVLPEHLNSALDVLSDIMRPALRQNDFDEEKGVILEEIAMYDDNPFWVLWEHANERYFGAHPLGHRVLGTRESIAALTRDHMEEYFATRYSADNCVVAAAGNLDFDALVARVGVSCGHWKSTGATRTHHAFHPHEERLVIPMKQASRAYLACIWPAPAMSDPRRYAATMLAQILGDSEGSRLFWALIETGIAEEAQAQFDGHDGVGGMVAYAACAPSDADRVEGVIRDQLARLPETITQEELSNARAKVATAVVTAGERPAGRMRRLGVMWLYRGAYASLEDELAEIDRLTLQDLRNAAHDFPLHPSLYARVVPPGA